MAVVIYVFGRSEIVFQLTTAGAVPGGEHHAPIQLQVPVIAWGYYALAFLAGFSERWFLKIIEFAEVRADRPPTPPSSGNTGTDEQARAERAKAEKEKAEKEKAAKEKADKENAAKDKVTDKPARGEGG